MKDHYFAHLLVSRDADRPVSFARASLMLAVTLIAGCSGGSSSGGDNSPATAAAAPDPLPAPAPPPPSTDPLDIELRAFITELELSGAPATGRDLPSIDEPIPQLGKLLFFSKSLGGGFDAACVSCHHPLLGGGDGLSLSVGTGSVNPNLVGPGRSRADGVPNVPRNTLTTFNAGVRDSGMFWDSRVESINQDRSQNGRGSGIRTPDTALFTANTSLAAGISLPAAQAHSPPHLRCRDEDGRFRKRQR